MADPRFFKVAGPFTLAQIAGLTGATLSDPSVEGRSFSDVAALDAAGAENVSFLDNRKYLESFRQSRAGACFVRPEMAAQAPAGMVCLITKTPYKDYALTAQAFYPQPPVVAFRAPSAVIDPTAILGTGCHVGPGALIGPNVKLGEGCQIGPNVVIAGGVEIGAGTHVGAGAYVTHALIGRGVRLYPGVVIGRPGFGFAMDPSGFVSVPQLGRVIIEDGVEIGANSTIDRGAGGDTVIGAGSRIDNLVQIGHNVKIGRMCVIVAQTGIAGSTELGDGVVCGGQTGLAGHLKIGRGARIAAQSGIMRDIPPGTDVMGSPAVPTRQYMRQTALLSKLAGKKKENEE